MYCTVITFLNRAQRSTRFNLLVPYESKNLERLHASGARRKLFTSSTSRLSARGDCDIKTK